MALLKGYADALRRDGWEIILMDAGDAISGSAVAQFDSGKSVAKVMGAMGYRMVAPGNHEFDYNLSGQDTGYYTTVILPLIAAHSPATVSAVCLNLTYRGGSIPGIHTEPVLAHDGHMPGGDGVRIAVAGILTPYTATQVLKSGVSGYDFGLVERDGKSDHAATRRALLGRAAEAVKQYDRPLDIVIFLSHLGHDDSDDYAHGQISGRDLALVPNVDIIADAHSHNRAAPEFIGDAVYVNGGRYLEQFVEITLTAENGCVTSHVALRGPDDLLHARPSEAITALLLDITREMGLEDVLFTLDPKTPMTDENITSESVPLGRFVCRVMRDIAGADIALYNSGGIRAGLPPGPVTVGALYDTIPFQNDLVTFELDHADILRLFSTLPARGSNGFPQFHGVTVYAWENEHGELEIAGALDSQGVPIGPGQTYLVAINSFMAEGGDGYSFPPEKLAANHGDTAAGIIRHLRRNPPGDPGSLAGKSALLLYSGKQEAERAWEKAVMERVPEPAVSTKVS